MKTKQTVATSYVTGRPTKGAGNRSAGWLVQYLQAILAAKRPLNIAGVNICKHELYLSMEPCLFIYLLMDSLLHCANSFFLAAMYYRPFAAARLSIVRYILVVPVVAIQPQQSYQTRLLLRPSVSLGQSRR